MHTTERPPRCESPRTLRLLAGNGQDCLGEACRVPGSQQLKCLLPVATEHLPSAQAAVLPEISVQYLAHLSRRDVVSSPAQSQKDGDRQAAFLAARRC